MEAQSLSQVKVEAELIQIPDSKELEIQASGVIAQAYALQIINADSYLTAGAFRDHCIERTSQAEILFRPNVNDANRLHKKLLGILKACTDPFISAAKIAKQKMIAYDEEQRTIALKKQLELEAQEKKRAEQEALEIAELLEKAGDGNAAEAVLSEPIRVAPIFVKPETPKIEGFQYRANYTARVMDLTALVRAIVDGQAQIQAVQANQVFLNQQARALKEAFNYPGVEVVVEKV